MKKGRVGNPGKTALAGLTATAAMTAAAYAGPLMGMPESDFARILGSKLTGRPSKPGSSGWWTGMAAHIGGGTVGFSELYEYGLRQALPGPGWLRGLSWGAALFALSQSVAMPLLGQGFFSSKAPDRLKTVLGNLGGHLVYGTVLGAIVGLPDEQEGDGPKANNAANALNAANAANAAKGWRMDE